MSLARGARALAQLAAARCSSQACAQPPSAWLAPAQQLTSLWSYSPAQGFAASAAAQQAEPAAAAAAAPQPPALPAVYQRLEGRISERYSGPLKRVFAVVEVGGTQYKVRGSCWGGGRVWWRPMPLWLQQCPHRPPSCSTAALLLCCIANLLGSADPTAQHWPQRPPAGATCVPAPLVPPANRQPASCRPCPRL